MVIAGGACHPLATDFLRSSGIMSFGKATYQFFEGYRPATGSNTKPVAKIFPSGVITLCYQPVS